MSKLQVANPNELVGDNLRRALIAMKSTPASRSPFSEFLESSGPRNQRELIGILKAMLELRPSLSKGHCTTCVDVMRWLVRTKMADRFKFEVGLARQSFDAALTQAFVNMKKEALSLTMFWNLYKAVCGLVLPMEAAHTLMAAKQHWMDVAGELDLVTSSSELGKKMFAFAHDLVVAERVRQVMTAFSRVHLCGRCGAWSSQCGCVGCPFQSRLQRPEAHSRATFPLRRPTARHPFWNTSSLPSHLFGAGLSGLRLCGGNPSDSSEGVRDISSLA